MSQPIVKFKVKIVQHEVAFQSYEDWSDGAQEGFAQVMNGLADGTTVIVEDPFGFDFSKVKFTADFGKFVDMDVVVEDGEIEEPAEIRSSTYDDVADDGYVYMSDRGNPALDIRVDGATMSAEFIVTEVAVEPRTSQIVRIIKTSKECKDTPYERWGFEERDSFVSILEGVKDGSVKVEEDQFDLDFSDVTFETDSNFFVSINDESAMYPKKVYSKRYDCDSVYCYFYLSESGNPVIDFYVNGETVCAEFIVEAEQG